MRKAAKPSLITLALSTAAVLGYLAYRFTLDAPTPEADLAAHAPAEPAPATSVAESEVGSAPPLADALPDVTLANLAGEQQSIQSWPGKPLVVNFWATWCAPCLEEIPMLKDFQDANPSLTVVGIAIDTADKVEPFAEEMGFNYPILIGRTEGVNAAASFGIEFFALPFTIFTDAEGRTLGAHTGQLHQEHLDNLLAVLNDLEAGRTTIDDARARIAGTM